jgi:hypothetical protein
MRVVKASSIQPDEIGTPHVRQSPAETDEASCTASEYCTADNLLNPHKFPRDIIGSITSDVRWPAESVAYASTVHSPGSLLKKDQP